MCVVPLRVFVIRRVQAVLHKYSGASSGIALRRRGSTCLDASCAARRVPMHDACQRRTRGGLPRRPTIVGPIISALSIGNSSRRRVAAPFALTRPPHRAAGQASCTFLGGTRRWTTHDVRIRQVDARIRWRTQGRPSAGSPRFPATIRSRCTSSVHRRARHASPSADAQPHAATARGRAFASMPRPSALRDALTAQYIEHASRSSKIENQLWSALFDLTQAFLLAYQAFAREIVEPRAEREVAGAAARAHLPPDRPPAARRQDPALSATSSGSRRSGPSCTRCSRSRARSRSSASR